MPDTIITGGGDSGSSGIIVGVIVAIILVAGGLWLFNSGALNGPASSPTTVTIEAPAAPVAAPATPAPAGNS